MVADFITDGGERCYWACEECGARGRTHPLPEAMRVARLADDHNHAAHPEVSWRRHEINWKNAAYALKHHEPERWDMSAFADAQSAARARWMR